MKPGLKFGLVTGLVSGLWLISCFPILLSIKNSLDLDLPVRQIRAYSGLFSILILILGIYLGMREAKRRNGFHLTYGEAIRTGVIISVIIGILVALFSLLYCTVINPDLATYMASETEKAMLAAHDAPDFISRHVLQIKKEFSTSSQVMMALVGQIVAGTIGSLILGAFVRSKKQS